MPAWSALAWFEQAWAPGSWALVPPPPPPAPAAGGLPLPPKLLGWAPGKKPKKPTKPNVKFRPVTAEDEKRKEPPPPVEPAPPPTAEVLVLPIPPAPPPQTEPMSLGGVEHVPAVVIPLVPDVAPTIALVPAEVEQPVVLEEPLEALPEEPPAPSPTAAKQLITLADRLAQANLAHAALEGAVGALRMAVDELRAGRERDLQRQRDEMAGKVAAGLTAVAALVTADARASTVRAALRRLAADIGMPAAIPPEPSDIEAENERRRKAAELLADELPDED